MKYVGAVWTDLGLVFTDARGYPHNHDRVRRAFYKALDAAGVRQVVLYALRHTMATLVLHETKDLKLVATRLGQLKRDACAANLRTPSAGHRPGGGGPARRDSQKPCTPRSRLIRPAGLPLRPPYS